MAKEFTPQNQPAAQNAAPAPAPSPSFFSKKTLMIGIPIFVVQLAIVYFLMVKFIAAPPHADAAAQKTEEEAQKGETATQNIFLIKDVIINPAGTNGTRFLLTTVGIEVSTPEAQQELEKKEVQVRDLLNSILTSKGLNELVNIDQRELLRGEISKKVGELLKAGKLRNVYFSKFIIQ
ncbi:MAG TPA: flagellar basal body-associated FliL family protein [Bacteroidota bacterium]|nr:flagellar basal body-associated FliL family protein [Bacteroidota bacterium]